MNQIAMWGGIGAAVGLAAGVAAEQHSFARLQHGRTAATAWQREFDGAFPRDADGHVHGDVDAWLRDHPVPAGSKAPDRGSADLHGPSRHFGAWTTGAVLGTAVGAEFYYSGADWLDDMAGKYDTPSGQRGTALIGGMAAGLLLGRLGSKLVSGHHD